MTRTETKPKYPPAAVKTARRFIMRIELTKSAKDQLGVLANKHGMTQVALMSRLTEWFAEQSGTIQAAVLGHYPEEIRRDVARMILERMSNGNAANPSIKLA